MKTVTKEEFSKFIESYPRPLERDVAMMYEPPLITYNDFTLGNWPDSVVASYANSECYPKDGVGPYVWEENVYHVKEDNWWV